MCTRNWLIFGVFSMFAVKLQAHTALTDYEMPPPMQLPLHSDSQIAFSQYVDVPMLSTEEMKHAFPWLDSARPANQTKNEPQNKLRYVFYLSPSKIVSNRRPDVNDNTNSHFDSVTNFPADEHNIGLIPRSDVHSPFEHNYPSFQDQPHINSNLKYNSDILDSNSLQGVASNKQETFAGIRKLGRNCVDITQGDCTNESLNDYHKRGDHISYPSGIVINKNIPNDNLNNEGAAYVKQAYQLPAINDNIQKSSNLKNTNKSRDKISKINSVDFENQRVEQPSHKKYRNDVGSREKVKNIFKQKCNGRRECSEQNNNQNIGSNTFLSEEPKMRVSNDRTKSEDLPAEHRDNSDIHLTGINRDRMRKQQTHGIPSKRKSASRFPKIPSPYMEPPKLMIADETFYKQRSRNKRQKGKKRLTENDKEDRLKNHKQILDSQTNLKNHKTEYIRDHAPEHKEEKTSEAEVGNVRDRAEKKTKNPLELSSDGERIHFQIHGHNGPQSYIFGFDTGEGKNRHFRLEERLKDGSVKGHYGYYDPLGKLKMVQYSAQPTGGYQEKHHESSGHKS